MVLFGLANGLFFTMLGIRAPWEKRLDPERRKMERMLDEFRWR